MVGIYKIENIVTKDCYIGSSKNVELRWKQHKNELNRGRHHSIILQRAWDKYTLNNFVFLLLEECDIKVLEERENFYLIQIDPMYNLCPKSYSTEKRYCTQETKNKLSKIAKERNFTPPNNSKSVLMLDKNTEVVIKEFSSISAACKYLNKEGYVSIISSCCKGKRKQALNYKWKYK